MLRSLPGPCAAIARCHWPCGSEHALRANVEAHAREKHAVCAAVFVREVPGGNDARLQSLLARVLTAAKASRSDTRGCTAELLHCYFKVPCNSRRATRPTTATPNRARQEKAEENCKECRAGQVASVHKTWQPLERTGVPVSFAAAAAPPAGAPSRPLKGKRSQPRSAHTRCTGAEAQRRRSAATIKHRRHPPLHPALRPVPPALPPSTPPPRRPRPEPKLRPAGQPLQPQERLPRWKVCRGHSRVGSYGARLRRRSGAVMEGGCAPNAGHAREDSNLQEILDVQLRGLASQPHVSPIRLSISCRTLRQHTQG